MKLRFEIWSEWSLSFVAAGLLLAQPSGVLAGTYVQFRTVAGDIEVELLDEEKPETVANFLRYARNGLFQNVIFHRCVPGFVLQGGEFVMTNRFETNLLAPEKLFGYPNFPPIVNEYGVGPEISNHYGTLAMARMGGQTNSATSQWFFNLSDNPELDDVDGGFTVFGNVIGGTNVLNAFNELSLFDGIVDMRFWYGNTSFGSLLKELPVRYTGVRLPRIEELIYVDISLLRVRVETADGGGVAVHWNSVAGRTNEVQFTEGFPPQWQTLHTTDGTGGIMNISDESTPATAKFYRVILK